MCYMYLHALCHSVLNVSLSIISCYVACIFKCFVMLCSMGLQALCLAVLQVFLGVSIMLYLLTVCHAVLHVFPHNPSCCVTCVCRCVSV